MHPQLLTVVDKEVLKTWTPDEWLKWRIEPKLDGYRITYHKGQFLSRTDKPFHNLEHIGAELAQFPGMTFDGELYGKNWEDAAQARRSKNGGANDLKFCVFDMMPDENWIEQDFAATLALRRQYMVQVFERWLITYANLVEQYKVDNYHDFLVHHTNHLAFGCDGTVLKREDSLYEFKRTKTWLKVKPAETYDMLVIGMVEGTGKYRGMLGALELVDAEECQRLNQEHWVISRCSGMTDAQRKAWWISPKTIEGKTVEVAARGVHKSGKLIEPRFIRIRDDK